MTPADSGGRRFCGGYAFFRQLAQAGPKSLPADSSVHILSKRERKAQADSLKAQLRAQADSIASVKKAQAAAARKEKLAQIAKARQARATAKLDAAKQKEEHCAERTWSAAPNVWRKSGQAACQNREGDPERQASGVGSRFAGRRLPAGGQAFAALDSLFRDSLAADSLGRDSMQSIRSRPGLRQRTLCGGIRSLHLLEIPSTGWSRGIAG